jgi:hypothetical protein
MYQAKAVAPPEGAAVPAMRAPCPALSIVLLKTAFKVTPEDDSNDTGTVILIPAVFTYIAGRLPACIVCNTPVITIGACNVVVGCVASFPFPLWSYHVFTKQEVEAQKVIRVEVARLPFASNPIVVVALSVALLTCIAGPVYESLSLRRE